MRHVLSIAMFLPCLAASAAADWPQWRGPKLNGVSEEKGLPTKWSATENVAWRVPIPGKGHSSPIVVGERVFVTSALEEKGERLLLCLSRKDGSVLWQKVVLSAPLEKKHKFNNYASATPCSDGQRVYVTFLEVARPWLVCYDMEGMELWRKSPGQFHSVHGWATAPILYEGLVILNCDQDATAYLVAYDKVTGEERWRVDRPNKTRSYCVPLIVEAAGKTQMVLTGSKSVASYDPATGKQHWVIDGPTEQFVASPVFADETIFITAGFPTFHVMGIDPSGRGNVTKTHVRYHHKTGAYVPSPIAVGNLVFMSSDQGRHEGEVWCYEARSGKRLWGQKLGKKHWPSPVAAEGLVYFLSEEGETFVIRAGEKFELVGRNPLGEECYASPAISRGQIFIRTFGGLHCIGK